MKPIKYLPSYVAETPDNIAAEEHGPVRDDPGGDVLPFNHISDRRFEILVYLLKKNQHPTKRVTLMTGVAERGRDVTVHSDQGELEEINQCKLLRPRMTRPAGAQELLKLALYAHLDPNLLPSQQVGYELWAPGDFTGEALDLLSTWPKTWASLPLQQYFEDIKAEYTSFETLNWDAVKEWLVEKFPYRLRIIPHNGVDISKKIRAIPALHDQYFVTHHVMPADAVKEHLNAVLHGAGVRFVAAKDEVAILDRIKLFKPETRVCFGPFILGVPPKMIDALNREEYEQFVAAVGSAFNLVPVLMKALGRLSAERSPEISASMPHQSPAFALAVGQFLFIKAALQLEYHKLAGMDLFTSGTEIAEYRGKTDMEIREILAHHIWEHENSARQSTPSDPMGKFVQKHAAEFLAGFKPDEQNRFIAVLMGDMHANDNELYQATRNFLALVPEKIMIISDTLQPFENEELMNVVLESAKRVHDARTKH